ncbi:thioesterase II family protein [Actinokineospora fastidiosa]|uniref:thioesterase II family protein n=1 Tax=Actinokineospora fastidiosa TaxID=1816 RepID=UPI001671614A|nr:alpha/beta fold hydrolase [Actinokineospora fastidiosa]
MTAPADTTELWIRRFHRSPRARARLLALPHAGGGASYYFPLSRDLAPDIEVLAVQYPGRQDRRDEPCVETVEDLADLLVDIVEPWADLPLALFGHSMGASVAFEVAVRLRECGVIPACLVASGRRAPSAPRDERVHQRDDAGLLDEIRTLDGTQGPLLSDPEIVAMVLPAIRSDYRAAETYRFTPGTPRLDCPIHVLIGDSDPKVSRPEADRWAEHTTAACTVEEFPGGHFYLADHQAAVNARIAALITRAL